MNRKIVDKLIEVLHNEDLTPSDCEEVASMFSDRVAEESKRFAIEHAIDEMMETASDQNLFTLKELNTLRHKLTETVNQILEDSLKSE